MVEKQNLKEMCLRAVTNIVYGWKWSGVIYMTLTRGGVWNTF